MPKTASQVKSKKRAKDRGKKKIFIIDDHPLMRAGMARVIEMEPDLEVCGENSGQRGVLDEVKATGADVVLLDLSLRSTNGLEVLKDLRASGMNQPVLVVSTHDEMLFAPRVLRAGGNGYIMKESATGRLVKGLRMVLEGNVYLSDAMSRVMLNQMSGKRSHPGAYLDDLTDRELEVFELLGQGLDSRSIGEHLGISSKTVDAHRANIKKKLGLSNGLDLIRHAIQWVGNE